MGLLQQLPIKPKERTGWPWTEEVSPSIYDTFDNWPKISIVTPSFKQGKYIEETIRSVLLQNYPNLEYILIDADSKDETVNIIKKYEDKIHYWVSESDSGQSDAINKGFDKATGEIMAWINSDDYYCPMAFYFAAQNLRKKKIGLLYGNASYYYEDKNKFCKINVINGKLKFHLPFDLGMTQPATFWTKNLWNRAGILDVNLHYGFDWEWYLRASKIIDFIPCDKEFAVYRIHKSHKTGNGGEKRAKELLAILSQHNYDKYVHIIKKISRYKNLVHRIVKVTSKYRVGRVVYGGIRLIDKDFRKFSVPEVAEIFNKATGIYNFKL